MSNVFIGEPPENIREWIIQNYAGPSERAETIFTFTNNRTVSLNISGGLYPWKYDGDIILDYDGPERLLKNDLVLIDIGNTISSIEMDAFEGCINLTNLTIPNSVQSIKDSAFVECSSIISVAIPNSVSSIEGSVFASCNNLMSIIIPTYIRSIWDYTFMQCTSLTSVTIPNNVSSIGNNVFYSCSSLSDITIPDSVTSIGENIFYNCNNLTNITFQGKTLTQVKNIEDANGTKTYPWGVDPSIISAEYEPIVQSINDGIFHAGGGNIVTGKNMRFADDDPGSHVVIKDGEGQQVNVDIATDYGIPVTETRFGLGINENEPLSDGEEYTFEFSMLDVNGQPVTVTQTAIWYAE